MRTTFGFASRFNSITKRISSSDSSLVEEIPSSFPSRTSAFMCFSISDLFTLYGISVTTILERPVDVSSISAFARSVIFPRPVAYAFLIPPLPMIIPPVGKSGPGIYSISSSSVMSGSSMQATIPSIVSERLCGGIFVAIPTAIPALPFTSRLGNRDGKTSGSKSLSSKFETKSTVSFSISVSIVAAIRDIFASVYL